MKVEKLLEEKNVQGIIRVRPEDSVYEALEVMARHNIGAVVVMDGESLAGVFSERDYVRKGILLGRKAKSTSVSELMTAKVFTVAPENTIEDCMELFRTKRIRHLPVQDADGRVLGMLSIGDIVTALIHSQRNHIEFMQEYISGKL